MTQSIHVLFRLLSKSCSICTIGDQLKDGVDVCPCCFDVGFIFHSLFKLFVLVDRRVMHIAIKGAWCYDKTWQLSRLCRLLCGLLARSSFAWRVFRSNLGQLGCVCVELRSMHIQVGAGSTSLPVALRIALRTLDSLAGATLQMCRLPNLRHASRLNHSLALQKRGSCLACLCRFLQK